MSQFNFYNVLPNFNQEHNDLTEMVDISSLDHEVDIVFPYKILHPTATSNIASRDLILQTYPRKAYSIMFSPKSIANTVASHDFKDLVCEGVNIAIGQEDINRLPYANYFRLPMWCIRLFGVLPTVAEINTKINELEVLRKQNPFTRTKFVSLVARRDKKCYLRGVRGMILDLIEDDEQLVQLSIESAGRFRNNTRDLWDKYQDNKVSYLQQFTFNICGESMHFLSSVSEKIADCLLAGCIPIYWGDIYADLVYFNEHALIKFDPSKRIELVPRLKALLANHDDFIAQNIFHENAGYYIYRDIYAPIVAKLEEDLGRDIYTLRKHLDIHRIQNFSTHSHPEYFDTFIG